VNEDESGLDLPARTGLLLQAKLEPEINWHHAGRRSQPVWVTQTFNLA